MNTRSTPRALIKKIRLADAERETLQKAMDKIVADVNLVLREEIKSIHHDFARGRSVFDQRTTAVSALNTTEGTLQFRVSGSDRFLLARLSTGLFGITMSSL